MSLNIVFANFSDIQILHVKIEVILKNNSQSVTEGITQIPIDTHCLNTHCHPATVITQVMLARFEI